LGSHHRPSRRRRIRGRSKTPIRHNRRMEARGNPNVHHRRSGRGGFGATRRFTRSNAGRSKSRGNPELDRRVRRKVREPRQLGDPPEGGAEGARIRGNSENQPFGTAGRRRIRGNPETRRKARLEERLFGATRGLAHRTAEGCEIWGNPKLRRRHSLKMRKTGQPDAAAQGWGTMHGPVTCK
jgi:hypothetical protein